MEAVSSSTSLDGAETLMNTLTDELLTYTVIFHPCDALHDPMRPCISLISTVIHKTPFNIRNTLSH